jgi:hypothetical protein
MEPSTKIMALIQLMPPASGDQLVQFILSHPEELHPQQSVSLQRIHARFTNRKSIREPFPVSVPENMSMTVTFLTPFLLNSSRYAVVSCRQTLQLFVMHQVKAHIVNDLVDLNDHVSNSRMVGINAISFLFMESELMKWMLQNVLSDIDLIVIDLSQISISSYYNILKHIGFLNRRIRIVVITN